MELCPLAQVQHRITLGDPLPFAIRDRAGAVLVAAHEVVADAGRLAALVDGGAGVAPDELPDARAEVDAAPPDRLPALWRRLGAQLASVLPSMPSAQAPRALADAAATLAALTERAPDLALFLLVRPDPDDPLPYGIVRSLHAATVAYLVARRLAWTTDRRLTCVKAAFTMNLGMLDLQERLSNQARLPSPGQRQAIQQHPTTSVASLRGSGVVDEEWLEAVAQHHEKPGGGGYPAGLAEVGEMANALRTVDLYTAKLAGRSGRDALAPGRAARDLLVLERGNPAALALIADFGPWPPGSLVRLQSGEVAIVVQRATDTSAPVAAVIKGRRGETLAEPLRREAHGREHGIAGAAEPHGLQVPVGAMSAERLYAQARY